MAQSKGKQFEERFKKNWECTVDNSLCYRLYDTTMGYHGIVNAGDFICYKNPTCFIIDCKSTKGNTFSAYFRQYEEMAKYDGIEGLQCGVIIWFYDLDAVVWVPFKTFRKIRNDGLKSFNYKKMINDDNYFKIKIPSKKLRTFMDSDYSYLVKYYLDNIDNTDLEV